MLKKFAALTLTVLTIPAHSITFTGEGCEAQLMQLTHRARKYPVATLVSSDELSILMEQHKVELPRSDLRPGVVMSDRERARFRDLQAVFPALLNRKLKFQISYDDGSNGHVLGALRRIDSVNGLKWLTITIEGFGRHDEPEELKVRAGWITALNGINHAFPKKASRTDIEAVRALRATDRQLLGKLLKVGTVNGVLIAARLEGTDVVRYGFETGSGVIQWVEIPTDERPNYTYGELL